MKTITLRMLVRVGACSPDLRIFERLFGDAAEATPEHCAIAVAERMNVVWLVFKLGSLNETKALEKGIADAWADHCSVELLHGEWQERRKETHLRIGKLVSDAINALELPELPVISPTNFIID